MKNFFWFLIVLIFFLIILIGNKSFVRNSLFYIDWSLFNGFLSRSIIMYEPKLNRSEIARTQFNFDYSWLEKEEFIFIAHRGGEYFVSGQNTKKTIMNSLEKSVSFIEIDLVFDKNEDIVCITGENLNIGACNLEWLMELLKKHSFFLIVDLKFNVHDVNLYKKFYEKIMKKDSFQKLSCKIIPQVYNFEHLMVLKDLDYPTGPIFTTYRTNIPNSIIYDVLLNTSIKAMTFPFTKINFLEGIQDKEISFFTHPIKNEKELHISKKYKVKGIYTSLYKEHNGSAALSVEEFTVCPNT